MEQHSGSPILFKIVSENRFSGKTYFYKIATRTVDHLSVGFVGNCGGCDDAAMAAARYLILRRGCVNFTPAVRNGFRARSHYTKGASTYDVRNIFGCTANHEKFKLNSLNFSFAQP